MAHIYTYTRGRGEGEEKEEESIPQMRCTRTVLHKDPKLALIGPQAAIVLHNVR